MTAEKLKELLESGAITQEEFDEMIKNVKEPEPTDPEPAPSEDHEPIDYDKLDKIIQSRVDKQLAAARKANADLEKKLKRLQQAKLDDDELKQIEIEEKERAIAEREQAILDKENRLYAVKRVKEEGLDDGSDLALAIVDFVMGEDETEIDSKVKAFKELFDKAVATAVDKRFKEGGYTPKKGETLNGGKNPYIDGNLTEQMALEIKDPETAAKLRALAGVK